MSAVRTLIVALALASAGCSATQNAEAVPPPFSPEQPTLASIERGRIMTVAKCEGCHAVGPAGDSAMTATPPLRDIANLYPPTQLQEAFAEGVMTGHPAMPQFELSPSEINDLIAYLETLRSVEG